jgi:hypothetical protein
VFLQFFYKKGKGRSMKKLISFVLIVSLLFSQPAQANFFTDLFGGLFTITTYPFQLILGSTKSPFFVSQNPFVEKEWHKEERVVAGRKLKEFALATQEISLPSETPAMTPKSNWDEAKDWVEYLWNNHKEIIFLGMVVIGILVDAIGSYFLDRAPAPRAPAPRAPAPRAPGDEMLPQYCLSFRSGLTLPLVSFKTDQLIANEPPPDPILPPHERGLLYMRDGEAEDGEMAYFALIGIPNQHRVLNLTPGQDRREQAENFLNANPRFRFKALVRVQPKPTDLPVQEPDLKVLIAEVNRYGDMFPELRPEQLRPEQSIPQRRGADNAPNEIAQEGDELFVEHVNNPDQIHIVPLRAGENIREAAFTFLFFRPWAKYKGVRLVERK